MIEEIYLKGGYWNAYSKFSCMIGTADIMEIDIADVTIGFRIIKVR